jgi:hypothetical protein
VKQLSWVLVLAIGMWPALARAGVERFAVIVGNNQGAAEDGPLQYAESDATRVYDVLRDLEV